MRYAIAIHLFWNLPLNYSFLWTVPFYTSLMLLDPLADPCTCMHIPYGPKCSAKKNLQYQKGFAVFECTPFVGLKLNICFPYIKNISWLSENPRQNFWTQCVYSHYITSKQCDFCNLRWRDRNAYFEFGGESSSYM